MKNVYKSEQRLCPIKCGNWRLGELYVCDVDHAGARVSNRVRCPAIFAKVRRVVPFVTAAGVSTGLVGSGQSLRTFLFVLAKTRACWSGERLPGSAGCCWHNKRNARVVELLIYI